MCGEIILFALYLSNNIYIESFQNVKINLLFVSLAF